MNEVPAGSGRRKAAVTFIFITSLLDVVSLGIMIPVLPNLVRQFAGGDTGLAAQYSLVFSLCWGLMQFICSPILGMLSDHYGRRPVLLISIFGLGVDYLFMALAPTLGWLLIGRIINGITAASFSTANAYVADITPPEGRAKAFGLMGAAFGVGFIIGPGLGGVLGEVNLRLPFFLSAALALCNWLYGYFVLPESLAVERRSSRLAWRQVNPLASLSFLRTHRNLVGLAVVYVLLQLSHNVLPSIFVLYVGYAFHWGPLPSAGLLIVSGLANIIVQTLVVGPVVRSVGERGALLIGLATSVIAFVIYGIARTPFGFYVGIPLGAVAALTAPGIQSLMSRRCPASQQGSLQGMNSAFLGICSIIGPVIYLSTLSFAIRTDSTLHLPGSPFLIAGFFCMLALWISFLVAKPVPDADALKPA
jgi:MFS transporter, DHA1 family, tetracycline resistance protein